MSLGPESNAQLHERQVFLSALEKADPADRAAFLDAACRGNAPLRQQVEALLREQEEIGGFLETPAFAGSETPAGPSTQAGGRRGAVAVTERPGDRIGRYRLLQELGEGGAGTVFMAEQEEPVRRRVALKVLKPGMDTKSVIARFESERQALALMDHPNIAKVLDAGATNRGRPYFVMELVRGIRITDYCDQNKLPTRERLDLFMQVCQAIQHAHHKGIIHRDIKPSNILVTLHDGVPVPKVIDFGIAKALDQRLTDKTFFTEFQAFIGTPAYTSPEQAEMSGLDIDTRTDVYSLGVLLYEMLTGRTPFDPRELLSSGLDGMRRTIRERDPVPPSTCLRTMHDAERTAIARRQQAEPAKLASVLRGDLDWIVLKALEKDRTRRYETPNALAMDIRRYLDNEPVLARPPSTVYQFRKFVRRNQLAFAAAGAFTAALLIGLAFSTWQFLEKSRAYRRASEAEHLQTQLREEAEAARRLAEAQALEMRRKAYAADISVVQQALAVNNLGRARELLEAQRPAAGQTDLRGWEWRYLWQHCQSDALFDLCRQSNEVSGLAASADGKWVAVAESQGRLTVWDLRARQEVARFEAGGFRPTVAFSPTEPWLAFGNTEGAGFGDRTHRIRLWHSVERRFGPNLALNSYCQGLAFSADGTRLMTATADRQITVWRTADGQSLVTHRLAENGRGGGPGAGGAPPGGPGFGAFVRASADLRVAACALDGGRICLVDLETGRERWAANAAEERVAALAFSPDGKLLASSAGFVESAIRLWDTETGAAVARLEGHRTWVSALVFWPDGETLASASADQTVRLWDVGNLRPFRPWPQSPPAEPPRFESTRRGRPPRPWTATLRPFATLRGHQLEVWSLALLPDATTLVSGSKDGTVCVWDTTTLQRDHTHLTLPKPVRTWQFAPDSQSILTIDDGGRVVRWQGPDYQDPQAVLDLARGAFRWLLSPNGRLAAGSTGPDRLQVWDLEEKRVLQELSVPNGATFPIAFIAPSNHLITREFPGGTLREWDVLGGRAVATWDDDLPALGFPQPTAFSPDAQWWLAIGEDGVARLRNRRTQTLATLNLGLKQIGQAAFSPDGRQFAAVSRTGAGVLWQTDRPAPRATLRGFLQAMNSVAFSPDGRRLAIGGDGSEAVKLWDLESLQELLTLEGEGSGFHTLAFSPDGNLLGSSNGRGTLHLWRAPAAEELERNEPSTR